ncbi:RpiB/LacA/LacB family sugar-phosphate isomerase [Desulfatitalea alkaliphila]|uniref:RpiB/LacA/LacB family sugar-phosphate isomerase n=1 Tax=Desulfatitalea alkaliphila TaxID=2929485 RepID=A0AA41UHH3_9BACT|nr:RpiB/LacA/LacB family sugar-phosphate isomerase [Desulfatitalea alkaliphila]MCJ8499034.1 RpiB/LacA/LacB family sugar-phosphate isomerase [Desulfatitalea alkaliphila]
MRLGIAADHGGYELKNRLLTMLGEWGCPAEDWGAHILDPDDDYPDIVAPLARAVSAGKLDRAVAICGSGVGACIVANKIPDVRAALITDCYSARQGVEDDDMNFICLGGRVVGYALACELIRTFIAARFQDRARFRRRLRKMAALEPSGNGPISID